MKKKHLIPALFFGVIWAVIIMSSAYGLWNAIQNYTPENLAIEQAKADTEWTQKQAIIEAKNKDFPFGHQVKALQPSSSPLAIKIRHFARYFLTGLIDFYIPKTWAPRFLLSIEHIIESPMMILMLLFTLIFNLTIPIITTGLFVATFRKEYQEEYKKRISTRYEEIMMEYLFGDLSAKEVAKKMRKAKSRLGKDTIIDSLMNYERNLSGEYADRIIILYRLVGLHRFSIKKIKSRKTNRRVSGIRELSNLYPLGALTVIKNCVSDKNHLVRSEAQIAYSFLDPTGSYSFLDNLTLEFSTWTQLNILNYVKLHEQQVPLFQKWLDSPNEDVQIFCIRMIQYFQQIDCAPQLTSMLYHPNRYVREHIYKAIRALDYSDAKNFIIGRYFDEISHNKYEILQTIETIGSVDDTEFLLLALDEESSVNNKLLICKTLINFGESGKQSLIAHAIQNRPELFNYIDYIMSQKTTA